MVFPKKQVNTVRVNWIKMNNFDQKCLFKIVVLEFFFLLLKKSGTHFFS